MIKNLFTSRKGPFSAAPAALLLLIVLLVAAAHLRFVHLTEAGARGTDTFFYIHVAASWAEGDYILGDEGFADGIEFYRPMAYLMFAGALELFDFRDYAIKYLVSFLDLVNILLIFYIGKRAASEWVGLFSAVSYAFLPLILMHCRLELLHIPTETFVLLCALFLVNHLESDASGKRLIHLACSGLALSLAANIHPDLAYLAPGCACMLLLHSVANDRPNPLKTFIGNSLVFSMAFAAPFIAGGAFFGFGRVYHALMRVRAAHAVGGDVHAFEVVMLFWDRLRVYMTGVFDTPLFLYLFLVALAVLPFASRVLPRKDGGEASILPWMSPALILAFLLGHAALTPLLAPHRLFIPLAPFVFLHIYTTIHLVFERVPPRAAGIVVIVLITAFAVHNSFAHTRLSWHLKKKVAVIRWVHDRMGDRVDENNKLLVAPHTMKSVKGFQSIFYFDETNVIHIKDCDAPWDEFIERNRVRYVFLSNGWALKPKRFHLKTDRVACFGTPAADYSQEWEYDHLVERIRKGGGKALYEKNFTIFDLFPGRPAAPTAESPGTGKSETR